MKAKIHETDNSNPHNKQPGQNGQEQTAMESGTDTNRLAAGWEMAAVRRGEEIADRFYINPYIKKAAGLTGILYTLDELARIAGSPGQGESRTESGAISGPAPHQDSQLSSRPNGDAAGIPANGAKKGIPGIFENPALPLVLDVGCYKGLTVIEIARYNPGINTLGIDLKYKRVVKSCQKILRANLSNAKIAVGNAAEIVPLFPDGSLFGALLFFPDPWQKRKQQKHRLLNRVFIEELYKKLATGGFAWLKTDSLSYFEEVTDTMTECGFTAGTQLPQGMHRREYRTIFEDLFITQNLPVYRAVFSKNC